MAATHSTAPATVAGIGRGPTPVVEQRKRMVGSGSLGIRENGDGDQVWPPASKKVKLAMAEGTEGDDDIVMFEEPGVLGSGSKTEGTSSSVRARKDSVSQQTQTPPASCLGQNNNSKEPANIPKMRAIVSEQFDVEILLKHRELRLIEQEIAKTQICIEQMRRCTLKPYASVMEASFDSLPADLKPAIKSINGTPQYAPPPFGVVDGPYTRHYRQWLLPDPMFDGYEGGSSTVGVAAGTRLSVGGKDYLAQALTGSGRPQRQSAMKIQQRGGTGVQQCLYRRNDGVVVRLECIDCGRSNFSSAQGFINHCRIAHQREYSSHDAAAQACGMEVDEPEQVLVSPLLRTAPDVPARNTRQTSQGSQQLFTPHASFTSSKLSFSENSGISAATVPPVVKPTTTNQTSKPSASNKRKNKNHRAAAAMTTPKISAPVAKGKRMPTPPLDRMEFSTPHLEGLLKRKMIDIDLQGMVKEFSGERIDWDKESVASEYEDVKVGGSDGKGPINEPRGIIEIEDDLLMPDIQDKAQLQQREIAAIPTTSKNVKGGLDASSSRSAAGIRLVSKISPIISPLRMVKSPEANASVSEKTQSPPSKKGKGDIEEMIPSSAEQYDGASSSDEDYGYKSDADIDEDDSIEKSKCEDVVDCNHDRNGKNPEILSNNNFLPNFESLRPAAAAAAAPITAIDPPSQQPTTKPIAPSLFLPMKFSQPAQVPQVSPIISPTSFFPPQNISPPAPASAVSSHFSKALSPITFNAPPTAAAVAAGLAKQVRFSMPSMRKVAGSATGVFENGIGRVRGGGQNGSANGGGGGGGRGRERSL